ncbi:MAG: hypothetical protein JWO15_2635 [Sphingomonadales bacterium]|nr:hypothetical protein [Sphingomonadales bacterium]
MNALIPAFVAVLLAEIGGPLTIFARARRTSAALAMLGLLIIAVVGGWAIAAILDIHARTLLLGLALLFAGSAQFGQRAVTAEPTIIASGMMLYRSPAPFLAFAFTAWISAPFSTVTGAIAGVGAAVFVGSAGAVIPRAVRMGAGMLLCLAGLIAGLNGLRLV